MTAEQHANPGQIAPPESAARMPLPVSDRKLFGFIHYSSESDLAAVIMHTGCLFVDVKSKDSSHRQFHTVTNLFETMCCSETEYHKRAVFHVIPNDLRIKGVLVSILICPSPQSYQAINRNGIRSREALASSFSFRICDSRIITKFDNLPLLVPPSEYRADIINSPFFHLSYTGDIGIKYSQSSFTQFISCETAINGVFDVYRVFIDSLGVRYEIRFNDTGLLSLYRFLENFSIDVLKRKNYNPEEELIIDNFDIEDVIAGFDFVMIKDVRIENIDTFLLMNIPGKMSRSPSMKIHDEKFSSHSYGK